MPDWRKLVNEHLAALALEPYERAEIVEELATHLDETFLDLRRRGFSEEDAAKSCLSEVSDWPDLRRKIQSARRKEHFMSNRITQFWFPGLMTFVLSETLLALMQKFGPNPWILAWGQPPIAMVYIPWLLSLPLIGGIAAYLSHRAGGSRRAVLSSIVFPVPPFLAMFLLLQFPFYFSFQQIAGVDYPVSLIIDWQGVHHTTALAFYSALLGWVLVPGAALLAGGLAFQLFVSRRLSARRIAGA
jgi:hypothetical protein